MVWTELVPSFRALISQYRFFCLSISLRQHWRGVAYLLSYIVFIRAKQFICFRL